MVSPCAYVIGLLDEGVVAELGLHQRGLEVYLADPQLWVPFDDGTAFAQWMEHDRTLASLKELKVSQADIDGYFGYEDLFDQIRIRLRKGSGPAAGVGGRPDVDTWAGTSPTRAELDELLAAEQLMQDVVFRASISDVLDEFVTDQRLKDARLPQPAGAVGHPQPRGEVQRLPAAVAVVDRRARRDLHGPGCGRRHDRPGRRAALLRALRRGGAGGRVRRDVRADRCGPVARPPRGGT